MKGKTDAGSGTFKKLSTLQVALEYRVRTVHCLQVSDGQLKCGKYLKKTSFDRMNFDFQY